MIKPLLLLLTIVASSWSGFSQEIQAGLGIDLIGTHTFSTKYKPPFYYTKKWQKGSSDYRAKLMISPYINYYTQKYKFELSSQRKILKSIEGRTIDFTFGKRLSFLNFGIGTSVMFSRFNDDYDDRSTGSNVSYADIGVPGSFYVSHNAQDSAYANYNEDELNILPFLKIDVGFNINRVKVGYSMFFSLKKVKGFELDYGTSNYNSFNLNHQNLYIRYDILSHRFSRNQSDKITASNIVKNHWRWKFNAGVSLFQHLFTTPVSSFYDDGESGRNRDQYGGTSCENGNCADNQYPRGYVFDYKANFKSSPMLNLGVVYQIAPKLSTSIEVGLGTIIYQNSGNVASFQYFEDNETFASRYSSSRLNYWKKLNAEVMYTIKESIYSYKVFTGATFHKVNSPFAIPGYTVGNANGYRLGLQISSARFDWKVFYESYIGLNDNIGSKKLKYYLLGTTVSFNFLRFSNFKSTILK